MTGSYVILVSYDAKPVAGRLLLQTYVLFPTANRHWRASHVNPPQASFSLLSQASFGKENHRQHRESVVGADKNVIIPVVDERFCFI